MVLFKRHLVVVKLVQLVFLSPGKANLFLLTVTRTQCVSVLLCQILATSSELVTVRLVGIVERGMKNTVFVPVGILVPTP